MTTSTSYRQLQSDLKAYRDAGYTLQVKLNAKKATLQAELERILNLRLAEKNENPAIDSCELACITALSCDTALKCDLPTTCDTALSCELTCELPPYVYDYTVTNFHKLSTAYAQHYSRDRYASIDRNVVYPIFRAEVPCQDYTVVKFQWGNEPIQAIVSDNDLYFQSVLGLPIEIVENLLGQLQALGYGYCTLPVDSQSVPVSTQVDSSENVSCDTKVESRDVKFVTFFSGIAIVNLMAIAFLMTLVIKLTDLLIQSAKSLPSLRFTLSAVFTDRSFGSPNHPHRLHACNSLPQLSLVGKRIQGKGLSLSVKNTPRNHRSLRRTSKAFQAIRNLYARPAA